MGELLLVNILREHLAREAAVGEGWLRGLGDACVARALVCMHREPQRAWSVETLAVEAGMSRTRFSMRFKELVGATPIGYLTAHRMALAAQQMEAGGLSSARIAENAGYDSPKVFARAFRRWSGHTPKAWLAQEAAKRSGWQQQEGRIRGWSKTLDQQG